MYLTKNIYIFSLFLFQFWHYFNNIFKLCREILPYFIYLHSYFNILFINRLKLERGGVNVSAFWERCYSYIFLEIKSIFCYDYFRTCRFRVKSTLSITFYAAVVIEKIQLLCAKLFESKTYPEVYIFSGIFFVKFT